MDNWREQWTAAQWLDFDPILQVQQIGIEIDTGKAKVGDGQSKWSALSYFQPGGGGGGGGTLVVAGETGTFNADPGHYYYVDCTSGDIVATLTGTHNGDETEIIRIDNTSNTLTVTPAAGLVNNSASFVYQAGAAGENQYQKFTRDTSNWWAGPQVGTSGQTPLTVIAASGASQTLTLGPGGSGGWDITLTAACNIVLAGATTGSVCSILLLLRGAGSHVPVFDTSVEWPSGITPSWSTTAALYDVVQLVTADGGSHWNGSVVGIGYQNPTVPGVPTNLAANPGNAQNVLSWAAPANGGSPITAYKVYRSTSSGAETLETTLGNVTNFTDTGLTNGTTYYYEVSAVNAIGEGTKSAEASATPTSSSGVSLVLDGNVGMQAHASDAASNTIAATAFSMEAKLKPNSWATGTQSVFGKWQGGTTGVQCYLFYLDATGKLNLAYNNGASSGTFAASTAAVPFSAGATGWVRATASGTSINFYTSSDGTTWAQLGTTVTGASPTSGIVNHALNADAGYDTTASPENMVTGNIYYIRLYTGVAGSGGSILYTLDFTTFSAGQTSLADSAGTTWILDGTHAKIA